MNVIQNLEALTVSDLRKDALAIAEAGYAAIDIDAVIQRKIHVENAQLHIGEKIYPLTDRRVFFIGIGKCALQAGRAIETLLGDALTAGIVLDISTTGQNKSSKIEVLVGTHPLPSETNAEASKRILEFLSGRSEGDLVIMLISGGGSALLSLPVAPMTFSDERMLFETLTSRGAPIQELNIVRKHISHARGGALAVAAYPAEVVSLVVSDVPGDDIGTIASGPTALDSSTVADAEAILKRYVVPASTEVAFLETSKDEKYFKRVTNTLFLSNQDALSKMEEEAVRRGYTTTIVDTHFSGEARDVGHAINEKLRDAPPKTALLYGGESTVTLGASMGKGGRNQEMALAALKGIQSGELILPFASDGRDNTEHAGAIADEITRMHIGEKDLLVEEYLDKHSSYDFFEMTGDALVTGPLESNVSDLVIALKA